MRKSLSAQRWQNSCKCTIHIDNDSNLYDVSKCRKISQNQITMIIEKGLFTSRRKYVCEDCLDRHAPMNLNPSTHQVASKDEEDKNSERGNQDQYVDNNDNEKNDEFEDEELVQKEGMEEEKEGDEGGRGQIDERDNNLQENEESCEAMNYNQYMKALCSDIAGGVTSLYKQKPCRDMSNLLSYNISSWLNERPAELIKHLQTLCNLDHSAKSDFLVAKMIEHIYDCRNKRLVLPVAFRENLVTYKMSNSPLLTALNGSSSPSGAHTFLTMWLNNNASQCVEFAL